jgi:hypothetical protein
MILSQRFRLYPVRGGQNPAQNALAAPAQSVTVYNKAYYAAAYAYLAPQILQTAAAF